MAKGVKRKAKETDESRELFCLRLGLPDDYRKEDLIDAVSRVPWETLVAVFEDGKIECGDLIAALKYRNGVEPEIHQALRTLWLNEEMREAVTAYWVIDLGDGRSLARFLVESCAFDSDKDKREKAKQLFKDRFGDLAFHLVDLTDIPNESAYAFIREVILAQKDLYGTEIREALASSRTLSFSRGRLVKLLAEMEGRSLSDVEREANEARRERAAATHVVVEDPSIPLRAFATRRMREEELSLFMNEQTSENICRWLRYLNKTVVYNAMIFLPHYHAVNEEILNITESLLRSEYFDMFPEMFAVFLRIAPEDRKIRFLLQIYKDTKDPVKKAVACEQLEKYPYEEALVDFLFKKRIDWLETTQDFLKTSRRSKIIEILMARMDLGLHPSVLCDILRLCKPYATEMERYRKKLLEVYDAKIFYDTSSILVSAVKILSKLPSNKATNKYFVEDYPTIKNTIVRREVYKMLKNFDIDVENSGDEDS